MSWLLALLLARSASRTMRRCARGWWLLAAASAAAPGGCAALEEPPSPAAPAVGQVVRVIDGDTIVVRADGERLTVRLLGIDTPETHGGPVECGGSAASHHLARIAPAGSRVRLVTDPGSGETRDRYGRLLAYVDGRRGDLGERLLRAGLAYVYRYRGRRFSRLARYARAEDDARAQRRATWSGCAGDFHSGRRGRQP
ncbi:MAG: thermonuclease family protein [Solirubrobacteraceae bacterium]